ncbi:MAG: TonB-dependent receptor [Tannerella sp.]|jgi:TonB-linked SusC/RagA family outer membrane protein|nr:TonB-dependent receptor [Tannerella sp.]
MEKKKNKRIIPDKDYKKLLRIMKLSLICLFAGTNMLLANLSYAQVTTFDLNLKNVTLEEVFDAIRNQSEFDFFYNNDLIDTSIKVSVQAEGADITDILDNTLPTQYTYKISDRYILISKRKEASVISQPQPRQAKRQITGTVVDTYGDPIVGVNVVEEETTNGTTTDTDGNFDLSVAENAVLKISYIGYITQEVQVGNVSSFNIVLREDVQALGDIVVVGYAAQKKVNLTGSVASIDFNNEKLARPVTTIAASLSGMAAGVNVMNTSSQPNAEGSSVLIRGIGTINNASPLILVDGMEMSLNEINPNDVASVSILKDAASCSIYGNRGANGVILVTTKRGSDGQINVSYSGKFSYNTPAKLIRQVTDYADYMEFVNEGYTNSGQAAKFSQSTINGWREASNNPNALSSDGYPNYVTHPNTDWYDAVYRPKWMQEHTVSLKGAEKRTSYALSGTYLDNPGLVLESGVKKYYFRSDIESKVTDFLAVGMRAWGYNSDHDRNALSDLWGLNMQKVTPGVYPYYNGMYGGPETNEEDGVVGNPLLNMSNSRGYYKQSKYYVNPYVEIKFLKDFKFSANFYYDHFTNHHKYVPAEYKQQYSFNRSMTLNTPPTSTDMATFRVYDWESRDKSWKTNFLLNWGHKFGTHDVNVLIGYEEYRKWGDEVDISKEGMSSINLTDFNAMTDPYYIRGYSFEYSSRSFFGRVNYAYDDRYLLELNMRYDGSSRFSPDSRWGLFPSLSGGWRISEEAFMEGADWLNNLKIRGSWGKLGNNAIGNYEWQALYGSGFNYVYNNNKTNGLAMTTFSNYSLEWEETAITNIGVDFSVLRSRLSGTVEVYDKNTTGILYRPTLPESLNQFTSPLQNLADVNNKGIELTLNWNDRVGDFTYSVSGNFTYNKNEVTKYKGELIREWRTDENGNKVWYQNVGTVSNGGTTRILEGHQMNEFYMLNVYKGTGSYFNGDGSVNIDGGPKDGVIRTEDDMTWLQAMFAAGHSFYPNQGIGRDKIWYGDMIYADYNGDGIYGNDNDYDFQGTSNTPKYYFGWQANMTWKGFDLSMNWAGAAGFKIDYYKQTQNSVNITHGYGIGKDVAYDHYFYNPENPSDPRTDIYSKTPRLVGTQNSGQANANSTWHLQKGNYMKLKNLTFGYTFPKNRMKVAYIQNARVYASGENLLTITKFGGSDPERMSGDGYMPMRQFAIGVNVTF